MRKLRLWLTLLRMPATSLTTVVLSLILAVLVLLLALLVTAALTVVFARQAHTRRATIRILDLLLRLAPRIRLARGLLSAE